MRNKTYNIITIGCQMNKSDSERMAGYLEKLGYKLSDDKYQADLVAINTCGVRQSAEDRIYGIIPRIKKQNPAVKIILTGCLSERKDVYERLKEKVDIFLPIIDLPKLNKSLRVTRYALHDKYYLNLRPKYNSKLNAFVPIGNGCDNFCSYCVVPMARGREVYRPAKDIIQEVDNLATNGYKEISLIAQNVNSYKVKSNKKFEVNFADLLRMANDTKGDFWIRFSTSHPKDMSDELIKAIAECDKVCGHIHLPVQAGDDKVLKAMNRGYTIEHYKKLIKKIRRIMPNSSITTDAIVGFPGETKEQFNNTVELFKEMKFDMAYISKYSPRYGTAAEKFDDNISKPEKKKREEKLMEILRKTALGNNNRYIGKVVKVLVEGKKGDIYFGKTRTSKVVRIKNTKIQKHKTCAVPRYGNTNLVGEFVDVRIKKIKNFGFEGELLS